jgi:cytochrome c oxidase subunit IV
MNTFEFLKATQDGEREFWIILFNVLCGAGVIILFFLHKNWETLALVMLFAMWVNTLLRRNG